MGRCIGTFRDQFLVKHFFLLLILLFGMLAGEMPIRRRHNYMTLYATNNTKHTLETDFVSGVIRACFCERFFFSPVTHNSAQLFSLSLGCFFVDSFSDFAHLDHKKVSALLLFFVVGHNQLHLCWTLGSNTMGLMLAMIKTD